MAPENDHMIVLLERTARMDEKLDALLDDSEKHDDRIAKLEKHVNMGYGLVAGITFIVSAFAQFFWEKIVGKGS
jgi:hypothetical protein